MDIYKEYEKDSKYIDVEKEYYIFTVNGGAIWRGKSGKYYVVTCPVDGIYEAESGATLKKGIIRWPISVEDYDAQNESSAYFHTYGDGVIYKVRGRLLLNTLGDATILYVKEVLESDVHGTKLDKKQEKYHQPIQLEDDVMGLLNLKKEEGLFEGTYDFNRHTITIYIEVEWNSKRTWKKPLAVARDFITNINERDEAARMFAASVDELLEAANECCEDEDIAFTEVEHFSDYLKNRMKYIFVNQNGSYTIGYDDGGIFGGHEIDVDVDKKGNFKEADVR